jgi:peptidoglycan-associated lipoprotein
LDLLINRGILVTDKLERLISIKSNTSKGILAMNIPSRISNVRCFFLILSLGLLFVGCSSTKQKPAAAPDPEPIVRAPEPQVEMYEPPPAATAPEDRIMFEFDSSLLKRGYNQEIQAHIEYLKDNPVAVVTVEGHSDNRGTDEYNLSLGNRRARSVRRMMVSYGISSDRINVVSRGEDYPLDQAEDMTAWAQNRRVEFIYTE